MKTTNTITNIQQPYLFDISLNKDEFEKQLQNKPKDLPDVTFYNELTNYLKGIETEIKQDKLQINPMKKIIGISLLVLGSLGLIFTTVVLSISLLPFTASLIIGALALSSIAVGIYLTIIGFKNPVQTFLDECGMYQGIKEIINGEYATAVECFKTYTDKAGLIQQDIVTEKLKCILEESQSKSLEAFSIINVLYFFSLCMDLREMRIAAMEANASKKSNELSYASRFKCNLELADKVSQTSSQNVSISRISYKLIDYLSLDLKNLDVNPNNPDYKKLCNFSIFSLKKNPGMFVITPSI